MYHCLREHAECRSIDQERGMFEWISRSCLLMAEYLNTFFTLFAQLLTEYPDTKEKYLRDYCASAQYIMTILVQGYKFNETWDKIYFQQKVSCHLPALPLDKTMSPSHTSKSRITAPREMCKRPATFLVRDMYCPNRKIHTDITHWIHNCFTCYAQDNLHSI